MVFARYVAATAVVLVAFSSAVAGEKKYEKKAEEPEKCYKTGARCAGEKGYEAVDYYPCCEKGELCIADKEMGWGRFCKKPADEYWSKCYIDEARCEGAPGKPYVEYHKCCGKAKCVEDEKLGWGKFCKGGDYDKKKYTYHKKEEEKETDEKKSKSYKGTYYESKDGKIKYESYDKKKVYEPKYEPKKPKYEPKKPKYEPKEPKYEPKYPMSSYGKEKKGKGKVAAMLEPSICRLGGGVLGAGCGNGFIAPTGRALFYLTVRIPGCRGGLPCNAAALIRNRVCGAFPQAGLLCQVVGESFSGRQVVSRQFDMPPAGQLTFGLFPPTTAPATTTTTTGAIVGDGTITNVGIQVGIDCALFDAATEASFDAAALAVSTTFRKVDCPTVSPAN